MSNTMIEQTPKYEAYKDSGVEWIGAIPATWQICRMKYLLSERNERTTTGKEPLLALSKYRGVALKDSFEERAGRAESLVGYKKVAPNQLVINKMQAVNGLLSVSYIFGITSPDYSVYKVKQTDILDIEFLNYALNLPLYLSEFKRRVTGVMEGFIRLYTDDLYDIPLLLPPIEEQKDIVRLLKNKSAIVDDAIAIKQKQIELLKERKQIITQQAVTQGLNPDVPMKNSGVDWIEQVPEHWEMKRVKHIFEMVMEASEKNNSHELLSVYSDIGVKPRKELEERGNKASSTDGYWIVKSGDIIVNKLLAWMGAIGLSDYDGVTSPAYDILRPRIEVDGYFYHLLFRAKIFSSELKRHSRGIMDMRLRLYFDKFGVVDVPYPPIEEQRAIVSFVKKEFGLIDDGISVYEQQINKLKEYKTTLINSVVTGKIKVTELA